MGKEMKFHVLSENRMREIGFTDHRKSTWYLLKPIDSDITFNLTINKKNNQGKIDVLDEKWLQPYDWQYYMKTSSKEDCEFPYTVHEKVQKLISELMDQGIISDYELGSYI